MQATLHWVGADAVNAEVRLYDHLFNHPTPGAGGDYAKDLNPNSLVVLKDCKLEPSLAEIGRNEVVQFERQGYFCLDRESEQGALAFNRTVGLRDMWAKAQAKG